MLSETIKVRCCCWSTYTVRRSCRLCRRFAILSARTVGLDLFVFTNSAEYCPKGRTHKERLKRLTRASPHQEVKRHKSNMALDTKFIWALLIFRCSPTGWLADSLCSGHGQCKWISCCFSGLWSCSEPWPQRGIDGPKVSDKPIRSGTAPSHTGTIDKVMWWGGRVFVFWTSRYPFKCLQ